MESNYISQGSWTESFHQYQAEIMEKIKKGETEDAIPTGGGAYTQTEWKKVMKSVDQQLEDIREEQEQRLEKQKERAEARAVYEAAVSGKGSPVKNVRTVCDVPYGYLAKDGEISYNGVTFLCDQKTNSICLGDVSDRKNTLVIPLSEGGQLKVNRNNLDELQRAIGMFSPEDVNRILRAIAKDNKAREMEQELEDEKDSVTELAGEGAQDTKRKEMKT